MPAGYVAQPSIAGDRLGEGESRLRKALAWGFLVMGVGALCRGQWFWGQHQLRAGLPLVLLGILLATAAARLTPARFSYVAASSGRLRAVETFFLLALVFGGGWIRFVGLDHLPPGGFHDEVQYHLFAERILAGDRPIFIADLPMPAFFIYLLAAAIAVAGKGLATVRGFAALLGTLTLPAFYLLARRAFALPVAAAATLLLVGSRWHITFSRVLFSPAIIVPLLEVLAFLLLWRAFETKRRRDYLLLGLVMGLGLQTYYAFNLFPAVLLVAVVSYAARQGWRNFWPGLTSITRGLGWSVLVAAILLIPLARFAVQHPDAFFSRSRAVAIWNPAFQLPWPGALWENIGRHLLMFNFLGDTNPRHNIPDAPLLNPMEGVLLALGLGLAIARIFKWPQTVWLAWFAVMLLPAILTIEAPQAHRAVGAIPAVYLLMGEGLQGLYAFATGGARRLQTILAAALLFVVSAAAASQDVWRYFHIQVRHPLAWQAFQADYHAIARYIRPFRENRDIWISSLYYEVPILKFQLGEGFPYQRFRLSEHLPMAPARSSPQSAGNLYLLEPFQKDLFPLFQSVYAHARLEEHLDPFGRPMFVDIFVPRSDLAHPSDAGTAQGGLLGAYYSNEKWEGTPVIVRREPTVLFHFHWEGEALPGSFTADWAASLKVEEPGLYAFQLVTGSPTLLLVDDQTVIVTRDFERLVPRQGTIKLSRGEHRLVVRYLKKGYASTVQLLWEPPSASWSVIPMRLLRPLPREEYLSLRDRLPRPETQ